MLIVDAHLDLAHNALQGQPVLHSAREQPPGPKGPTTVGLPDLRTGDVRLICGTIFCAPDRGQGRGYRHAEQAAAMAHTQLHWYQNRFEDGELRLVRTASDLPGRAESQPARAVAMLLLMEGADPLRSPADVAPWVEAGLRMVGLAWKRTRYAGGTDMPGPLTPAGLDLVRELDAAKVIHDLSHLAEQAFWQLLETTSGPVAATHSNCQAIVPTDRQLSDAMIRAIAARGGVIGINLYDRFLLPPDEFGRRRANLDDVVRHIRHMADLVGGTSHIGIGTDMDGGFGRAQIPCEIATSADLPAIAAALNRAGFTARDVAGIMGENWLRFFTDALPPERVGA